MPDASGTPTSPDNIPKYNTAADPPSGKGFNTAMDAIQAALTARVSKPSGIISGEGVIWNGTTWVRSSVTPMTLQGYGLVRVGTIGASGTFSPQATTTALLVQCIGAGGGGGGSTATAAGQLSAGAGGGGGGYAFKLLTGSLKASYTVVVGAAGAAGTVAGNGGTGGNTSFDTGPIVCQANGGAGGGAGGASAGNGFMAQAGAGGGFAIGDWGWTGGYGFPSYALGAGHVASGAGGASATGGAGGFLLVNVTNPGNGSGGPSNGGGGSGGSTLASAAGQVGGAGGAGAIVVWEYRNS